MSKDPLDVNARDPVLISSRLDEIRERVRDMIHSGALQPGERVNEQALAARLGVGRNAAREALRSLEPAGLVRIIPNRGAEVRRISLEEALDLYDVRAGIARTSGRLLATRLDEDAERTLREFIERMDAAIEARDGALYHRLNTEFHGYVMEATRNPRLIELNNMLEDELKLYLHKGVFSPSQMQASNLEHRRIVQAVLAGDAVAAADALESHILAGKQRMLDTVAGQRSVARGGA